MVQFIDSMHYFYCRQTKNISEVVNDAIITATRYMIATYNVDSEQKRSTGLLYKVCYKAEKKS